MRLAKLKFLLAYSSILLIKPYHEFLLSTPDFAKSFYYIDESKYLKIYKAHFNSVAHIEGVNSSSFISLGCDNGIIFW